MVRKLPKQIHYLESSIRQLEKLDDPADEDSEVTPKLVDVFRNRIRGLSSSEATRLLLIDQNALASWLAFQDEHPGHFILGFLDGTPELVKFLESKGSTLETQKNNIEFNSASDAGILMARSYIVANPPLGFQVHHHGKVTLLINDAALSQRPTAGAGSIVIEPIGGEGRIAPGAVLSEVKLNNVDAKKYELGGKRIYMFSVENKSFVVTVDGAVDEPLLAECISSIKVKA